MAYSAAVRMYLTVGSRLMGVAQVGPDFMILDEPVELPPGCGELLVELDGDKKRRSIDLPDGIRPTDVRTRIAPA